MDKPSILIVGADPDLEARLVGALRDVAKIVGAEPPSLDRALESYRRYSPDLVIVAVTFDLKVGSDIIQEINRAGGHTIVVGPTKDPDLILHAMRAGAREFVIEGDVDDLRRAVRLQARSTSGKGQGTVVTVFPAKGGVGATSLATNLAGALTREGHSVCLLDLDLHLGDVLSFLDLPVTYSITDVIANMSRLDRELLETSIARHQSGVRVLGQSSKVEEAEHVRGADVAKLIAFLRQHYDRIVIDGTRGFDEISLAALDASHQVLLVFTQDVPSVRNAQRCLDLFRRLGYEGDRVHLILNRYQKSSKITAEVVTDALGVRPTRLLANDFAAVIGAINRGNLLSEVAPRSRLTRDIDQLVEIIAGDKKAGRTRSGFFRSLFKGGNGNGTTRTPDAG